MESIFTELALYGSKNECARTAYVFSPISEVCDGTVSPLFLSPGKICAKCCAVLLQVWGLLGTYQI